MDKRHYILHHLYGETDDDAPDLHDLLDEEELREEYQALSEVKFQLDHRRPSRPAPEVLDHIMTAAAGDATTATPVERPPLRLLRFGAVSAMAAMFALLLAVGLVWRQGFWNEGPLDAPQAARQEAAAPPAASDADSSERDLATPPAPLAQPLADESVAARERRALASEAEAPQEEKVATPEAVSAEQADAAFSGLANAAKTLPAPSDEAVDAALADEAVAEGEAAVPEWDETDDLLRLHRRLEMLEARSASLAWDDSSVISLDVLPTGNSRAPRGLNTVGTPKRNQ